MHEKPHILAQSRQELGALVENLGFPKYRGDQLADWVFKKLTIDLEKMSNLPADLKKALSETLDFTMPEIAQRVDSQDGSSKLLLQTARGLIEAVILRYEERVSLCVSSQVGCKLACSFCQTGKLGFMRHLSEQEIVAQFFLAAKVVRTESRRLSHVVFMGMGEPLDNFEPVVRSVDKMTSEHGYGLSAKNVTVSTSGIVPKIGELAERVRCSLAVSLHAATDELRSRLMPINRKWPLKTLKEALIQYQKLTGRKITIEYILIEGENCDLPEAKALVRFLAGLRAKVNLIPFNAHPGLPYKRPSDETIRNFQKHLATRSIPAPVRYSKGLDVSAACGQLAAKRADALTSLPKRSNLLPQLVDPASV